MTALENVAFPIKMQGVPKRQRLEQAEQLMKSVQLCGLESRRINELSGGQQQRVSIARALVGNPAILLADEPTGALDSKTGQDVLQLFQELNDMGNTILMITHDPSVGRQAKQIVRIIDGRLYTEQAAACE